MELQVNYIRWEIKDREWYVKWGWKIVSKKSFHGTKCWVNSLYFVGSFFYVTSGILIYCMNNFTNMAHKVIPNPNSFYFKFNRWLDGAIQRIQKSILWGPSTSINYLARTITISISLFSKRRFFVFDFVKIMFEKNISWP